MMLGHPSAEDSVTRDAVEMSGADCNDMAITWNPHISFCAPSLTGYSHFWVSFQIILASKDIGLSADDFRKQLSYFEHTDTKKIALIDVSKPILAGWFATTVDQSVL